MEFRKLFMPIVFLFCLSGNVQSNQESGKWRMVRQEIGKKRLPRVKESRETESLGAILV